MIVKSSEFVKSATIPSQYPPANMPEIAFAGRSNVGKSSLINTLVNRKRLVKTSSTPGRTQLINFFMINNFFMFVDLPGYGYAKVPHNIRKKWGNMIETYMLKRETLKGVVFILDIRRTPGQAELDLITWLNYYKISYIPVLTKSDKLKKQKQINQQNSIADTLSLEKNDLVIFSAKTRKGKERIWANINKLINRHD